MIAPFDRLGHTVSMYFILLALAVLGFGGIIWRWFLRRDTYVDRHEFGSVSTSWLAEHRTGRSD
jgi:hypothetical protein